VSPAHSEAEIDPQQRGASLCAALLRIIAIKAAAGGGLR